MAAVGVHDVRLYDLALRFGVGERPHAPTGNLLSDHTPRAVVFMLELEAGLLDDQHLMVIVVRVFHCSFDPQAAKRRQPPGEIATDDLEDHGARIDVAPHDLAEAAGSVVFVRGCRHGRADTRPRPDNAMGGVVGQANRPEPAAGDRREITELVAGHGEPAAAAVAVLDQAAVKVSGASTSHGRNEYRLPSRRSMSQPSPFQRRRDMKNGEGVAVWSNSAPVWLDPGDVRT